MYTYLPQSKEADTASRIPAGAPMVQCSLAIGAVNDPLEHEADSMADKVMSMQEVPQVNAASAGGMQRKCAQCEDEEKVQRKPLASFIQRKESSAGTVASESVSAKINSSRGGGSNLDNHTQSFMQSRFGADFSDVKIHTGGEAIQMNRELNARAFTVGNDIYFNEGQYDPASNEGKHLLAHELTHTVQQGGKIERKIQKAEGEEEATSSQPESSVENTADSGALDSGIEKGKKGCSKNRAVAILGGRFTHQLSGHFFSEVGCPNILSIVMRELTTPGNEIRPCNTCEVRVDGVLLATINSGTSNATTSVSLNGAGLTIGQRHSLTLTILPDCINVALNASVSIR